VKPFQHLQSLFTVYSGRHLDFDPPITDTLGWMQTVGVELCLWLFLFIFFTMLYNNALTTGHRYFAHHCFRTSRLGTFLICCYSGMGLEVMWWSSIHRRHHRHCECEGDPHSPGRKGFWYAYLGWTMDRENYETRLSYVRDWVTNNPELLMLDLFQNHLRKYWAVVLTFCCKAFVDFVCPWGVPGAFEKSPIFVGMMLASNVSMAFNAFSHETHKPNESTEGDTVKDDVDLDTAGDLIGKNQAASWSPCNGKDIPWFTWISGGEAFHKRHHEHPNLSLNAHYWYQDYNYWPYRVLEVLGLVWDVNRLPPPEKEKVS